MHNLVIKSSNTKYQVNFYSKIKKLIESLDNNKTFYLIDENVFLLYKQYFNNKSKLVVPASEDSKTLEYSSIIFNHLIDNNFKTDTHLIIIGGGVLQDLGGFVASTFCRGIKYTLIPTTLLSQCDSCIGGKTSINHNNRKNILGTFYPPTEVKICTEFLNTLSNFDLKSGYGELNEFDLGERKLLNFGHSFGHALESISQYKIPHGSAIIIGMMIANEISFQLGEIEEYYVKQTQQKLSLYINHIKLDSKWFDFPKLLSYLKSDKKNTGSNINMILINAHGEYSIKTINDLNLLKNSVNKIYETIRLCN